MGILLSIDLGTEGARVGAFTEDGRALGTAHRPYQTRFPRPGWAEQDPRDWWAAITEATRELLSSEECRRAGEVENRRLPCLPGSSAPPPPPHLDDATHPAITRLVVQRFRPRTTHQTRPRRHDQYDYQQPLSPCGEEWECKVAGACWARRHPE